MREDRSASANTRIGRIQGPDARPDGGAGFHNEREVPHGAER